MYEDSALMGLPLYLDDATGEVHGLVHPASTSVQSTEVIGLEAAKLSLFCGANVRGKQRRHRILVRKECCCL